MRSPGCVAIAAMALPASTKAISRHADKLKTIQALQQIAAIFDTALIAEGIETEDDLRVLRDLGIRYGQGFFLGRPARLPHEQIDAAAMTVIRDRTVAVFPELRRAPSAGSLSRFTMIQAQCRELKPCKRVWGAA